ncbi:hypothetical protein Y600_6152 [Burkholderia pseudomallei MSHR3709]|nr:hypothetical protein Y600_6152 [Burkholderia pseudomallei MSHR3709]
MQEIEQFNHVQATTATFHLRDESLRTTDPVGHVLLEQSSRFA